MKVENVFKILFVEREISTFWKNSRADLAPALAATTASAACLVIGVWLRHSIVCVLVDGRQQQGQQSYATIDVGGNETSPHHEFIEVGDYLSSVSQTEKHQTKTICGAENSYDHENN